MRFLEEKIFIPTLSVFGMILVLTVFIHGMFFLSKPIFVLGEAKIFTFSERLFETDIPLPDVYALRFVFKTAPSNSDNLCVCFELVCSDSAPVLIFISDIPVYISVETELRKLSQHTNILFSHYNPLIDELFCGGYKADQSWIRRYCVVTNFSNCQNRLKKISLLVFSLPIKSTSIPFTPFNIELYLGEFTVFFTVTDPFVRRFRR
ncbi:hypothetical protein RF11_11084 [Thelohanellus kitauei]|uniref:Uncharacterized protein n=1 Tax=Thelohanellus kitauei TaxID=669202 RepID=A0A0C2IVP4_THEKT|nr:hypothetical protein RF11_11084 [Thelohanellus kitauei]